MKLDLPSSALHTERELLLPPYNPDDVVPARSIARIPASDPAVAEVVRLVNVARRKAGCAALRSDAQLATAGHARLKRVVAKHDLELCILRVI